jgi:hypothetical protein
VVVVAAADALPAATVVSDSADAAATASLRISAFQHLVVLMASSMFGVIGDPAVHASTPAAAADVT